jgi:hypothetical protein
MSTKYRITETRGETHMTKLLARFSENPSVANARKVIAYAVKHPMSACLLDQSECGLLRHASVVIENGGV